ncbi:alcohol dehydrogenase [Alicyclobacillus cellulosilyticus]|uniref:Alcohol dehydrogenase n=1 Tax=Alicyclobacillus cellulosilyticus TaxID=1003997 RepID=A0A917NI50_9BACL|nr:zinc-binding alcohol dehydrogenase family protein [Alicyclobacillus cellulosilyticus]GGJ02180.1 alcohol dehydrogenase [Alicyclobacillus cellulosilyticus]
MKCIVCQEPKRFVKKDVPIPTRQPGEALVRILRIGICGTDIHAFHGNQPYFTYPRVLGHELAGVIEEMDSDSDLSVGDQVAVIPYLHCGTCVACRNGKTNCCVNMRVLGVHADGGMAEFITVPTSHLIRTNGFSLEQSVILEPLSIGAHAVRRSGLAAGQTALVIGAGPIGLGTMLFAKQRGARVIAMDIDHARLEVCHAFARVDATVDARMRPWETLAALTNGEFPWVVFDATGNAESMAAAIQAVAHGGTLVYVGLVNGEIRVSDPELHKRELTLMGSRNATREDFELVLHAVAKGFVDVNRYITHRVAFDDFIDTFADWINRKACVIKAVIQLCS